MRGGCHARHGLWGTGDTPLKEILLTMNASDIRIRPPSSSNTTCHRDPTP